MVSSWGKPLGRVPRVMTCAPRTYVGCEPCGYKRPRTVEMFTIGHRSRTSVASCENLTTQGPWRYVYAERNAGPDVGSRSPNNQFE